MILILNKAYPTMSIPDGYDFEPHQLITINVPLFKKLRDIIFFLRDNHFMSHFKGHFEGAKTFRGQKSRGPLKMSREMAHKVIVPKRKLCPKVC